MSGLKRGVGELSLVIVVLVSGILLSNVIYFLFNGYQSTVFSFFDNLFDKSDNQNNISAHLVGEDYVLLSGKSNFVYKNDVAMENFLSSSVGHDDVGIESKTKNELDRLTRLENNKNNINNQGVFSYYKINNKSYIVSSYDDNTNTNYYYNYDKKNGVFNSSGYKLNYTISRDSENIRLREEKIINSEEKKEFIIDSSYDEDFVSKASVNITKQLSNDNGLIEKIYNEQGNGIVILNTYKNDAFIGSGVGFFISDGIIATSWSYLEASLKDGNSMVAISRDSKSYSIKGIVTIDIDADLALLKLVNKNGEILQLGKVNKGDEILLLGSSSGFGFSGKVGVNIGGDDLQSNSLMVSKNNIGSPLFNGDGKVIGMVTGFSLDKDLSVSLSSSYLKKYQDYYMQVDYGKIKCYSMSEMALKYYKYNLYDNEKEVGFSAKLWDKYKVIGDVENTIKVKLVKMNDLENIISLRYLNDTGVDSDIVLKEFINKLKDDKYKEILNTSKKKIYKSSSYEVTIYYELDYIIVIMESVT